MCSEEEACSDFLNKSIHEFEERAKENELFLANYLLLQQYTAEILPHIKDCLNIGLSFSTEN